MDVKNPLELEKLYTNQFAGSVKLTEAEWQAVEARSEKFIPRKS
jgi:hypothetical protein